jgi:DNA-binding CsgD family transcriptional regulator
VRITGGWESGRLLAQACEHAGLTRKQTEAASLAAGGASYRAIASELGIPILSARRTTLAASRKLRHAHPHLVALDRRFLRDLYACMRNVRGPVPATPPVYAALPGGGHDSRPVSLRPRPEGECPEDLQLCPVRWLRELPRLLAQCAAGE